MRQLTAELQRRQRDSSKLAEYLERLQYDSVGFVKKIAAGARRAQSRQYSARSDDVFVFDFPVVINYLRKVRGRLRGGASDGSLIAPLSPLSSVS